MNMNMPLLMQLTRQDDTTVIVNVDHLAVVDAIVELDRAGQPLLVGGAPRAIGSTVGLTGGAMIRVRETPEEIWAELFEAAAQAT